MIVAASISLYLFCFVSGPFNWVLQVHGKCCLFCKTISKVRFQITDLWISLKKGECLMSITI